jgi:hypothetical protein
MRNRGAAFLIPSYNQLKQLRNLGAISPIFQATSLASCFFRFFLERHHFVPSALVSFDKSFAFHVSEDSAGFGF